jgi:hypothetical protein
MERAAAQRGESLRKLATVAQGHGGTKASAGLSINVWTTAAMQGENEVIGVKVRCGHRGIAYGIFLRMELK